MESRFGREFVVDPDELLIPIQIARLFNLEYKSSQGFYEFTFTGSEQESRLVLEPRPEVIVKHIKTDSGEVESIKGLLVGTSLTGDGNAIEPALPQTGSDIAPIVIESTSQELSISVLK